MNGAQFVSAASVGKINVNNSNNNNTESNGDAKQVDLVKLSQNVDEMSKILTEHAGLFKKLTNSIDKLSNKLDNTIKNINTTNKTSFYFDNCHLEIIPENKEYDVLKDIETQINNGYNIIDIKDN